MSILIDVAAEFTGKKAFKQAETATDKLTKSAKSLGKTIGISLSTAAILGYAKASVKAAAQDQKAQKQLALALKNVGLERDAASAESYIQRLQSEFGVVDDLLRPAYQQLAVATGDTAKTQKLLGLALDLSASTGKDLSTVTAALSKAYLGNNTALSKLGVGISKADLKTKSFEEITSQLAKTFKGAASASAATFSGSIAKLGVASENVKEIIGTGLIDALKTLGQDTSISDLADDMERAALSLADFLRGLAQIATFEISGSKKNLLYILTRPIVDSLSAGPLGAISRIGAKARRAAEIAAQKNPIQSGSYLSTQKKITVLTKEQAAAQAKILADKKAQAILDKANLALNKGSEIFDMDKIQIAAALTNQAEQLGKATSASQLLQIANDTARLNVKQSILALEDAIASKDQAAIIAATAKLNEDLKILGALQNQSIKMQDIKSILDSLKPKDLINQSNLDEALRKIKEMLALMAQMAIDATKKPIVPIVPLVPSGNGRDFSTPAKVAAATAKLPASVTAADFFANLTEEEQAQLSGFVPFKGANIPSSASQPFTPSSVGYGTSGTGRQVPVEANFTFNINAGAIANPDELTGLIQDSIIRLNKQGDYLTTAGAL